MICLACFGPGAPACIEAAILLSYTTIKFILITIPSIVETADIPFLTGRDARPGSIRPGELGEQRGIWLKPRGEGKEEFVSRLDFKELAVGLIPKVVSKSDEIAQVYQWAMWVNASPGEGDDGEAGIWVETESGNRL